MQMMNDGIGLVVEGVSQSVSLGLMESNLGGNRNWCVCSLFANRDSVGGVRQR
jgi:hypothetical protein